MSEFLQGILKSRLCKKNRKSWGNFAPNKRADFGFLYIDMYRIECTFKQTDAFSNLGAYWRYLLLIQEKLTVGTPMSPQNEL